MKRASRLRQVNPRSKILHLPGCVRCFRCQTPHIKNKKTALKKQPCLLAIECVKMEPGVYNHSCLMNGHQQPSAFRRSLGLHLQEVLTACYGTLAS